MDIKFGTDGWRDIMGQGFNIQTVRECIQGLSNYLINTNQNNKILSNQIRSGSYDTNLNGQIADILSKDVAERLKASNPDFIMHGSFSQYTAS